MINRLFIAILGFGLPLVACQKTSKSPRNVSNSPIVPQYNSPGYQGQNVRQERSFNAANRQFRVLDPNFDFNSQDRISVSELNQRFPVHLQDGSQVAWLSGGPEYFAARMNLLNRAQKSVRIQSLIFENDESSRLIANKLIELANRGVSVKVVIDPVINFSPDDRNLYFQLQRNGIIIEGYEALYLDYIGPSLEVGDFGLSVGEVNKRYHEKMFIVDGELPSGMAIIGGVNLGNNYFRPDPTDPENMWRDRDALIRGPVVRDVVNAFEENHQEFTSKRTQGLFGDTSQYWGWANLLLGFKGPISMEGMRPKVINSLQSFASRPFNPTWQNVDIRFLRSRPRHQENLIMPAYIDMIDRAESEILINNSYFLPSPEFRASLQAAIKRGVKVRIITNHAENTDISQLHLLARSEYKDFLRFNSIYQSNDGQDLVEIYEWAGDPVLNNGEGLNHSKYAVFDRKAVLMGSFNIDPRSEKLNSESVIVFENPQAAGLYVKEFQAEMNPRYSQKISLLKANAFTTPPGLKEQFELKISEILRPLL